ncbi:serine-rich adhesin for platelets-like [Penaeus chinensis]|uniref:serine-rich adhesin for platelets-like n=1 Tax=Penaeus chinensis TaxID=139456 RepID=UPI001FB5EEA2|nr:serine-rich adhesin for platelets-like [Penaeus chinensis]
MEWKGLWNYVENLIPGKSRSQESVDRGDSNSQDSEDSQDTPPSPCRSLARRYPVIDEDDEEESRSREKAVTNEDEDEDEEGDIDGDGVSSSPSDSSDFEDSEGVDTEIENNTVSENSDSGKKGTTYTISTHTASAPISSAVTTNTSSNSTSGSANLSSSSTSGSTESTSSSTSSGSEENSADEEGRDGSESQESPAGNHKTKLEESKDNDKNEKNKEIKPNGEVPQHDHSDSDGDHEYDGTEKTCKDPSLAGEKDPSVASEKDPSVASEKDPSVASEKDPSLDSEKDVGQDETAAEGEGNWEMTEGEDKMENPKDAKTSVNVAILAAARERKKDEAKKECRQADVKGKIRNLEEHKVEANGTAGGATQEETESAANGKLEKTDHDRVGKNRRRRRRRGGNIEVEDKEASEKEADDGEKVETDTVKESVTKSTVEDKDKNTGRKKVTCRRADSKKGRGRGKLDKGRSQWLVSTEQAERGGSREYDRRMEVATSENSCGEEEAAKCGKNTRCGQESRAGKTETPPAGEESQADSGKESAEPDGGEARRESEGNGRRAERLLSENSDNDEDFSAEEAKARDEGEAQGDSDSRPARRTYDRLNARARSFLEKRRGERNAAAAAASFAFEKNGTDREYVSRRSTRSLQFSDIAKKIMKEVQESRSEYRRPQPKPRSFRRTWEEKADGASHITHTIEETTSRILEVSSGSRSSSLTKKEILVRPASGDSETRISVSSSRDTYDPFYHDRTTRKYSRFSDSTSRFTRSSDVPRDPSRSREGSSETLISCIKGSKLLKVQDDDSARGSTSEGEGDSPRTTERVRKLSVTFQNDAKSPPPPTSSSSSEALPEEQGAGGRSIVASSSVTRGNVEPEPGDPKSFVAADICTSSRDADVVEHLAVTSGDVTEPVDDVTNNNKRTRIYSRSSLSSQDSRTPSHETLENAVNENKGNHESKTESERNCAEGKGRGEGRRSESRARPREQDRPVGRSSSEDDVDQDSLEGPWSTPQLAKVVQELVVSRKFSMTTAQVKKRQQNLGRLDVSQKDRTVIFDSSRFPRHGSDKDCEHRQEREAGKGEAQEEAKGAPKWAGRARSNGRNGVAWQQTARKGRRRKSIEGDGSQSEASTDSHAPGEESAGTQEGRRHFTKHSCVKVSKTETKRSGGGGPRGKYFAWANESNKGDSRGTGNKDENKVMPSPRIERMCRSPQLHKGRMFSSHRRDSSSSRTSPRQSPIGSRYQSPPGAVSPRLGSSSRVGSPRPDSPRIGSSRSASPRRMSPRVSPRIGLRSSPTKFVTSRTSPVPASPRIVKPIVTYGCQRSPRPTSTFERQRSLSVDKDNVKNAEDDATTLGEETPGKPKPLKALRREMSDCRQRLESFVESRAMQEQRQQRYILITSKMSGKLDSEIIQFFESQQQKPREILRNEKVLHEHFRAGSKSDLRRASGSSFRSKSASTEGDKSSEDAKEGSEDDVTPDATHDVSFTRDITREAFPFLTKSAKESREEEGTEEDSGEGKLEGQETLKGQSKVTEKDEDEKKSLPVEEEAKGRNIHLYDTVADDKSDDGSTVLPSRDETYNHASITDHTGSVNTIPDDGNLRPGQGNDTIAGGENEEEVEVEKATAGGELDKDMNRGETGKREGSVNEDDTNEEGGSDEKRGEILTEALSTTSLETAAFEEEERGILDDEKIDVETRVKICEETLISSRTDNVLVNESVREERRYEEGPAKVKKGIVKEIIMQKEEEAKSKIGETYKTQQVLRRDISPTTPKGKDETQQDDTGTKAEMAPRKPDADDHPGVSPEGSTSNRDAAATNAAVGEGEDASVGAKESPARVRGFSSRDESSVNLVSQITPLEPSAEAAEGKTEIKDAQAEGTVRSPLLRRTVQSKETRTVEFNFVKGKGLVREERVVFRGARDLQEDVSDEASVDDKQTEASQPKEEIKEDVEAQEPEEQSTEEPDQNETLTAEDERHEEVAVSEEDRRKDVSVEVVVTKSETAYCEAVEVPHNTQTRESEEQVPEHMYANILPPPARVIGDEPREVTASPREEEMDDEKVLCRTTTAHKLMSGHRRLTKTISEGSFVAADESSGTERARPPSIRRSRTESEFLTDQLAAAATSSAEHKSAVSQIFTRGVSGKVRMKSRSVENIRLSSLSCVEITNPIDSAPLPKSSSACRIVGVLKKKDSRENVLELMSPSKDDEHEDEGEAEPQDDSETTKEKGKEEKEEDQTEVLSDLGLSNNDNLPIEESPVEEAIPMSSVENIETEVLEPIEAEVIQPVEDVPEEFLGQQDDAKGTNMSVISSAPIDSHIYENVPDVLFCRSGTAEVPTQFMDYELEHTSTPIDHSRKLVAKVVHIYENLPPPGVLLETSFGDVGIMGEFLPLQDVCVSKENTYEECVANEQRDSEPKFIDLKTAESGIISSRIIDSNTVETKVTELRSEARVLETLEPPVTPVVTGKPPKPSSDALSVRRPTYEKASLRRKQPESESRVEKQKSNYMRQKGVRVGILKKQKSDITGVRLQKLHYFDSELPGERRRSYSIGGDPRKGSKHGKGDVDKEQASHTCESSHDLDTSEASRPEMRDLDRRCHSSISASSNTSKSSRIDRILQSCAPCISSNTNSMLDLSVRSGVHTIGEESGDEDDDTYRGREGSEASAQPETPTRGISGIFLRSSTRSKSSQKNQSSTSESGRASGTSEGHGVTRLELDETNTDSMISGMDSELTKSQVTIPSRTSLISSQGPEEMKVYTSSETNSIVEDVARNGEAEMAEKSSLHASFDDDGGPTPTPEQMGVTAGDTDFYSELLDTILSVVDAQESPDPGDGESAFLDTPVISREVTRTIKVDQFNGSSESFRLKVEVIETKKKEPEAAKITKDAKPEPEPELEPDPTPTPTAKRETERPSDSDSTASVDSELAEVRRRITERFPPAPRDASQASQESILASPSAVCPMPNCAACRAQSINFSQPLVFTFDDPAPAPTPEPARAASVPYVDQAGEEAPHEVFSRSASLPHDPEGYHDAQVIRRPDRQHRHHHRRHRQYWGSALSDIVGGSVPEQSLLGVHPQGASLQDESFLIGALHSKILEEARDQDSFLQETCQINPQQNERPQEKPSATSDRKGSPRETLNSNQGGALVNKSPPQNPSAKKGASCISVQDIRVKPPVQEPIYENHPIQWPVKDASLDNSSLKDAAIYEVKLQDTSFHDSTSQETTLLDITLQDTTLQDSTLQDSTLQDTTLQDIVLQEAVQQQAAVQSRQRAHSQLAPDAPLLDGPVKDAPAQGDPMTDSGVEGCRDVHEFASVALSRTSSTFPSNRGRRSVPSLALWRIKSPPCLESTFGTSANSGYSRSTPDPRLPVFM